MAAPGRLLPRLRPFVAALAPSARLASTHTIKSQTPLTPIEPSKKQAHPIGPFYQAMLDTPLPTGQKTEQPPVSAAPKATPARKTRESIPPHSPSNTPAERPAEATESQAEPSTSKPPPGLAAFEKTAAEKAASIFGSTESRLKKMEEYRQSKSSIIEGVIVPPKPMEPDNCCMSGCVNCVWERFREDMEDFKAATAEVQRRREAREGGVSPSEPVGVSLADGSAGVDASLPTKPSAAKNMWDDSLYQDLPVGIREFMKTERRLKEAHGKEGTLG